MSTNPKIFKDMFMAARILGHAVSIETRARKASLGINCQISTNDLGLDGWGNKVQFKSDYFKIANNIESLVKDYYELAEPD